MHLANKLPSKEFELKHSFPLNNLIKYHHLGNLLIKVLNWLLFGKRSGKAFLPVSEKLGSSPLRQASERQISSLRWEPVEAFRNLWKPDLPCLSGSLLMTLSWVGSRELAFSKTPENLICLARLVFFPMALLGVGSRVLAPGSYWPWLEFFRK